MPVSQLPLTTHLEFLEKIMKFLYPILIAFSLLISSNSYSDETKILTVKNTQITDIESKILKRSYDLYIKLPYDYHTKENQNKKYPVVYLNDAPYTFKVAAGITHFPKMDKAIIVGIGFAHGENGQFSRVRDLTPEEDKTWTKYITGGAPQYLKFITDEVFPYIGARYRVNDKRILAGQSLGGSFGAWVLVTQPELFTGYILTSPSIWYKNHLILQTEKDYAKEHKSLIANVFIATGALESPEHGMRKDMTEGHRSFVEQLRSRNYHGLVLRDEIVDGTDHYSTFPVGLAKGLRAFLVEDR